jgi:hypothetical protein
MICADHGLNFAAHHPHFDSLPLILLPSIASSDLLLLLAFARLAVEKVGGYGRNRRTVQNVRSPLEFRRQVQQQSEAPTVV